MVEGLFRAAGYFSTLRVLAALNGKWGQLPIFRNGRSAAAAGCPRKISNAALPETFNHREMFLIF
jgi:hypothetical protein